MARAPTKRIAGANTQAMRAGKRAMILNTPNGGFGAGSAGRVVLRLRLQE
jgi:hypothetical protein